MADNVQVGDKVSWNWNGNQPSGTVGEVKAGEVSVTSHRGNEISKSGDESNPAVHIERSGNDVVKKASELNIDEKAPNGSETDQKMGDSTQAQQNGAGEEKREETATSQQDSAKEEKKQDDDTAEKPSEHKEKEDEAKTGEKRKADEKVDANEKESPVEAGGTGAGEEQDAKKQKTADDSANGAAREDKKAPGRPKSNGDKKAAPKKEKKVPAVGKTERKTRSQGTA